MASKCENFKICVSGKKSSIHRRIFQFRFENFFKDIPECEKECHLKSGSKNRDKAIAKVIDILIDYAYNSKEGCFEPAEESLIDLHHALTYEKLHNSTILWKVEEELKRNFTAENVQDRLKYAKKYNWTELVRECERWIKHQEMFEACQKAAQLQQELHPALPAQPCVPPPSCAPCAPPPPCVPEYQVVQPCFAEQYPTQALFQVDKSLLNHYRVEGQFKLVPNC